MYDGKSANSAFAPIILENHFQAFLELHFTDNRAKYDYLKSWKKDKKATMKHNKDSLQHNNDKKKKAEQHRISMIALGEMLEGVEK